MGPQLTAIALGVSCVVAAFLFRPRGYPFFTRAAAYWIVIQPAIFFLAAPIAELLICGVLLAALQPSKASDRAAFYLLALPAAPITIAAPITFPGINYLIILDYAKVVCIVALFSLLLTARPGDARRRMPAAGAIFVSMAMLYAVQAAVSVSVTEGMRSLVNTLLLYAIPYVALARAVAAEEKFDKFVATLLFFALIYAAIAAVSQLRGWNFYSLAGLDGSAPIERFGLIRISATSTPFILGYVALLGLLAVDYFRRRKAMQAGVAWLFRAAFLGTLAVTVSRGAWLGAVAGLAVFWFFTRMPRGARPGVALVLVLVAAPLALTTLSTADLSSVDQFGTFEYRQEMVRVSLEQIRERPLFGDVYYLEHPRFAKLIQGEGIVDIVNHYLEIALAHGLVALALYAAAWFNVIAALLSLGKILKNGGAPELEQQRAFLLATLVSILVIFATTSAGAIATHLSIAMLGISAGFVARVRAAADARVAASALSRGDIDLRPAT